MKKDWRTITFFVIATVAMAFAFATCSVDDLLADSSENGGNVSQGNGTSTDQGGSGDCSAGTAEHTWDTGKITLAATEDTDGEKTYTCTVCGKTKTEAILALGHEHTVASEWTSDETFHWHEASCEKEAHRTDKAAHNWDEGETTKAATENDDGEKMYTCTVCGKTKTETVPALGHEHTVASEWTSDEAHHWHEASCGREEHRADKATHDWDEGKTTKAATENDDGETLFTCTVCGATKTEAVPALGHEHTVASEWTSDEIFHWHEASCGREEHRTGKTPHEWDDGTITKAATCTAEGETTYTCTMCRKTRTESIAMIEHEWNDGKITKAPTCTTEGERTYTCTVCGKARTESIAANGHAITITLTSDGKRKELCATCGYGNTPSAWTKETLSDLSEALRNYEPENATVKVVGELTDTNAISAALLEFSGEFYPYTPSKLVALDLSETTGLTTVSFEWGFRLCNSLASIQLPSNVIEIGNNAFYNCKSLTNVTLPNGLTTIGDYAFHNCQSLTNITLPNSLTTIGDYAFYNCQSLTNITLPNGLTTIGDNAFGHCSTLKNITIPDSVTKIGKNAFQSCTYFTLITIPEGITEIASGAFGGCKSLYGVGIPSTCKKIGNAAFSGTSLYGPKLPEGLTEIGEYAFSGVPFADRIVEIPSTVTIIGPRAFYNCTSLTQSNLIQSTGIKFKDTARWNYYHDDAHNSSPCDVSDSKVNAEHLVYEASSEEIEHTWSKYGLFKK